MDVHRVFLTDPAQRLFRRAIRESVHRGDTVLDLGTGTGVHALFACEAGARRVYAVDADDAVHLAKEVARSNGHADRIVFTQGLASRIELPEKVDVIVTNQGFTDVVTMLGPARERFLKRSGQLIPSAVRLFAVPVSFPEAFEQTVRFWKKPHYGLDFSAVSHLTVNEPNYINFRRSHFLARPVPLPSIRLNRRLPAYFRWPARFVVSRSGSLHGLGVWFEYRLSRHVTLSSEPPMKIGSPPWRNVFFPFENAVFAREGDRVEVEVHLAPQPRRSIWKWTFALLRRRERTWVRVAQGTYSNFAGLACSAEALHRLSPATLPRRTAWGDAQLCALSLSDGRRTRADIERKVAQRFARLFRSAAEASAFVAEVLKETTT